MVRLTLRNLLAHKLRLVLSTLAVVLGIAFLSGVLTFNNAMSSTFDGIIKGSTPDAMVRAQGAESFGDGSAGVTRRTLDPTVVAKLRALPQVADAEGTVNGYGLHLLDSDGKLVGGQGAPTLAFNKTDVKNLLGRPSLELVDGRWPRGTDEITLDEATATNAGYAIGDEVTAIAPNATLRTEFTLVGLAQFNGGGTAGANLVTFSTAGAQKLFLDGRDSFSTIGLTAADGFTQQQVVDAATKVLPAGFTAVTGDKIVTESQTSVGQFLGIISTFLLVFAIIAIIVGGFIIVNTFAILVAQRVRELALLRALGAGRRQVTRSVLIEAFAMATIASGVGLVTGWLLALGLAGIFNKIGLSIQTGALDLTWSTAAACFAVGIVVTMASAYFPARRAAKVPPVAAMRDDALTPVRGLGRRTLLGSIALVLGAACAVLGVTGAPGNDAVWIGIGAFIWIITVAVISPVLGKPVLLACRAVFSRVFGTPGRLAGDNALRDPRRTGATASALMIGLALVSTIGVLASSMNASLEDVVDENFTSDFLVQSPSFQAFPTALADEMRKVDGVGVLSEQQGVMAKAFGERTYVTANDAAFNSIYTLDVRQGTQKVTGHQTLISTDFASEHKLAMGDTVKLAFPSGNTQKVTVAGIFKSDGYVAGSINVPFDVLEAAGIKRMDNTVAINVADGADRATVKKALDNVVADVPIVPVQDRTEFAASVRGQVDQLLYIIYGLLALAIVIAVIGIVNTLSLSVLERTREIGLLRAIGLSRRKLRRMVTLESVSIALLGSALGLVLGLVFGALLRHALRDQMTRLSMPTGQLSVFLAIAVAVGVIAAIIPAIRASRMNVLNAISTE